MLCTWPLWLHYSPISLFPTTMLRQITDCLLAPVNGKRLAFPPVEVFDFYWNTPCPFPPGLRCPFPWTLTRAHLDRQTPEGQRTNTRGVEGKHLEGGGQQASGSPGLCCASSGTCPWPPQQLLKPQVHLTHQAPWQKGRLPEATLSGRDHLLKSL